MKTTEELCREAARDICRHVDFVGDPLPVPVANIVAMHITPAIEERDREIERLKDWRTAVIDAVVIAGIYTAEHDSDPRKAIHDLCCYEQSVALSPEVSKEAADLHNEIERLRAENTAYRNAIRSYLKPHSPDMSGRQSYQFRGLVNGLHANVDEAIDRLLRAYM